MLPDSLPLTTIGFLSFMAYSNHFVIIMRDPRNPQKFEPHKNYQSFGMQMTKATCLSPPYSLQLLKQSLLSDGSSKEFMKDSIWWA